MRKNVIERLEQSIERRELFIEWRKQGPSKPLGGLMRSRDAFIPRLSGRDDGRRCVLLVNSTP